MPTPSGWHIHVYAGQSNETENGLGPCGDTTNAYDSRIFQVGRVGGDNMKIVPAVRPLDYWSGGGGRGAGLSRARLYIQNGHLPDGYNLLIIPAAKGGTSVLYWDGTAPDPDGDDLWGDMIARTNIGLALTNATVTMFVWRQIETDVQIAQFNGPLHYLIPDAHAWYVRSLALMDRVRAAFGPCPIVYTHPTKDFDPGLQLKANFMDALRALAAARPRCCVSDTADLGTNELYGTNGIHFNGASEEIIAARNIMDYESLSTKLIANFLGTP